MGAIPKVQTAADGNLFITHTDAFREGVKRPQRARTFNVYRIHRESFGKVHPMRVRLSILELGAPLGTRPKAPLGAAVNSQG